MRRPWRRSLGYKLLKERSVLATPCRRCSSLFAFRVGCRSRKSNGRGRRDQSSMRGRASFKQLRRCWHDWTVGLQRSEPRAACGTRARRRRASRHALVGVRHRWCDSSQTRAGSAHSTHVTDRGPPTHSPIQPRVHSQSGGQLSRRRGHASRCMLPSPRGHG